MTRTTPSSVRQADAFGANQERASRNFISDIAERQGPLANITGESRLAAERLGQTTGAFEAQLIGRELSARRDEIAQALQGLSGRITADQQAQLQRELATLDNAIQQQQVGIQRDDLGLRRDQLSQQDRQFMDRLGFDRDQLTQQGSQFDRTFDQQGSQFDRSLEQEGSQFDQQLSQQGEQFIQRLNQDDRQFGANLNQQDRQFLQDLSLRRDNLTQQDRQFLQQLNHQRDSLSQQDQQFLDSLGFNYDQLGLSAEDRAAYYDLVRRGLI